MSVCTASSPSSFPSRRAGAAKRSRRSSTSTGLRTPRSPSQTSSGGWCATTTPMATSAWSSERTSCGRCRRSGRGNRASATPPGRQTRAATGSCWHDGYIDATRVDVWLWAVRIYKTRSAATAACRGGHVRVNRAAAKASTPVKVGSRVEAFVERPRILEGAAAIALDKDATARVLKRLGYTVPTGRSFWFVGRLREARDIGAAYAYARRLGLPVLLKPNDSSGDQHVSVAYTRAQFYAAARE